MSPNTRPQRPRLATTKGPTSKGATSKVPIARAVNCHDLEAIACRKGSVATGAVFSISGEAAIANWPKGLDRKVVFRVGGKEAALSDRTGRYEKCA